mgnify:CR=1 FL=1
MYQMVFRFPNELKEQLKEEANKRGQTLTGLMKQILWEWLRKNEQEDQKKETVNG